MRKKPSNTKGGIKVRHSLTRKALLIISFPFLLHILFLFKYLQLLENVEKLAKQEYYSKAIINHGNWASLLLSVATNSLVGWVLTDNKQFLERYSTALKSIPKTITEAAAFVPKGSEQAAALREFEKSCVQARARLEKAASLPRNSDSERVILLKGLVDDESIGIWKRVYKGRHDLLSFNRTLEGNNPEALPEARKSIKDFLNLCLAFDLLLALFLIYAFNRQIAQRLGILTDNSRRLAEGRVLLPQVESDDEIAFLDQVFHETAERLEVARIRLEESENRVKQIIENMPVGLITLDEKGRLETFNKVGKHLLGENTESLAGRTIEEVFPTLTDAGAAYEAVGPIHEVEAERGGQPVHLEISRTEYLTSEGKLVLIALHDITARKEFEQMRQDFFNMVSHDLRSPLASVQIFHGMLGKGFYGTLNAEGEASLKSVKMSVQRLVSMVNDLLDLEKIQALDAAIALEPVYLQDIIEAATESIIGLAKSRSITLKFARSDLMMMGDMLRLTQILVNLLSNAIKFSPEGQTVLIETKEVLGFVEVSVIDFGRGVREENQEKLFEKFKQVERSDETEKGGVGLGLPICKRLVELHGGTIGIESKFGAGSRFWFRIPACATAGGASGTS